MFAQLKSVLEELPGGRRLLSRLRAQTEVYRWSRNGCPCPPPAVFKRRTIRRYRRRHGLRVLVETGTYEGDTVRASLRAFSRIYSIELSDFLYAKASERFHGNSKVTLLHGDSAKMLPALLEKIESPALFWLDGHYSQGVTARGDTDTPLMQELAAILASSIKGHVILVDDARLMTGENGYPSIDELRRFVGGSPARYDFEVAYDIIRICPSASPANEPATLCNK